MKDQCQDIFEPYHLPFKTTFSDCLIHETSTHPDLEILWVLKGHAKLTVDNKVFDMHDQSVFLIFMNKPHAIEAEPDTKMISYRLDNEYLHRRGLFFERIPYQGVVHSFAYLADKYRQVPLLLVQMLKILLSDERKDITYYKILAYYNFYAYEIYSILLKERYLDIKTKDYDPYLERSQQIVDYIYTHYNQHIQLKDLCHITKLSIDRLSHVIKDTLGVSFQTFLQNVRFEHALHLIQDTNLDIMTISKKAGFSDHKYLSRLMKNRFNKSVIAYRKSYHEPVHDEFKSIENHKFIIEIKKCLRQLEEDTRFNKLFIMEPIQL